MKTLMPKKDEINQKWYEIDATEQILGRLSTKIVSILRGKNKPCFSQNIDTGDYIVVTNAEKINISGLKSLQKYYKNYSGYPGGLKEVSYKRMMQNKPEQIIIHAVAGMLPKGPLGRKILKKLKVYSGNENRHLAQKPEKITL